MLGPSPQTSPFEDQERLRPSALQICYALPAI